MDDCCTNPVSLEERRNLHFLRSGFRWLRREFAYHALVRDLEHLPPALLEDLGVRRQEIRRFARAAVEEGRPVAMLPEDAPVVRTGDATWCRAFLLQLGL